MTTQREIREWCKPFVARYPMMVLSGYRLAIAPVYHVLRAVEFLASSHRNSPNVRWTLAPMFIPQNLLCQFGDDIPVGHSDWPQFLTGLEERATSAITRYLIPNETIEDFHHIAMEPRVFFFGDFRFFPRQHAIVLAALGRFDEAGELLVEPLAKLEASAAEQTKEGHDLTARRPKSAAGRLLLENGARDSELAGALSALLSGLRHRDATAVATLLHTWEQQNVVKWGVEQHWQPTPFPFETGGVGN